MRVGMLAAEGEALLMTNADLSTPIVGDVEALLPAIDEGTTSPSVPRALPGSVLEVRQPFYREMMGWGGQPAHSGRAASRFARYPVRLQAVPSGSRP